VLVAAICAGCANAPSSSGGEALAGTKKIALIKYQDQAVYMVTIPSLYSSGAHQVGLIPGLMLNSHFDEKTARLTQAINDKLDAPNLEKEYQQVVIALLQRRGVEVVTIPGVRDKYGKLDLGGTRIPKVDALLDLAFQAGYASATPTSSYRPLVYLDIAVYSPDKQKLFSRHLTRGAKIKEAPGEPHYGDINALVADPGVAFEQLRKHALGTVVSTVDLLRKAEDPEADAAYVAAQVASAPNSAGGTAKAAAAPAGAQTQISPVAAQTASVAAIEPTYPRTLSAEEITAHFRRNSYISVDQKGSHAYSLSFQSDGTVQRNCTGCGVGQLVGSMTVKREPSAACFEWNGPKTYTPTGCYKVVQTSATEFVMRGLDHNGSVRYSAGAR
jgi:hypothetical protein